MSERKAMIAKEVELPITRQCELLEVSRSSYYYQPVKVSETELRVMRLIDEIHLRYPFYGSRRIGDELEAYDIFINRKHVQRLMRLMGLVALYPRRKTSQPAKGHKVYPYLLGGLNINHSNHVWSVDITYVPLARGFVYLVAIMDWYSRKILSWRVSTTLESHFCVEALQEALEQYGTPEIFNSDQGSQFTSETFTEVLKETGIAISMDGKGRWVDNVFIERVWRSLKHEEVYLKAYETPREAREEIANYFVFYNTKRRHQSLNRKTPDNVYFAGLKNKIAA
jgi:putative transposase